MPTTSSSETDLVQSKKEQTDMTVQLEQYRKRVHAAEISTATEKVRLEKSLEEVRTDLDGAVAAREEALAKVTASEEQIKT